MSSPTFEVSLPATRWAVVFIALSNQGHDEDASAEARHMAEETLDRLIEQIDLTEADLEQLNFELEDP